MYRAFIIHSVYLDKLRRREIHSWKIIKTRIHAFASAVWLRWSSRTLKWVRGERPRHQQKKRSSARATDVATSTREANAATHSLHHCANRNPFKASIWIFNHRLVHLSPFASHKTYSLATFCPCYVRLFLRTFHLHSPVWNLSFRQGAIFTWGTWERRAQTAD